MFEIVFLKFLLNNIPKKILSQTHLHMLLGDVLLKILKKNIVNLKECNKFLL